MYCSTCGTKLDDSASFCPNCGTKIEREATPVSNVETSVDNIAAASVPEVKTVEPVATPVEEVKAEEPSAAPVEEVKAEEPSVAPVEEVKEEEPVIAPAEEVKAEEPVIAPVEEVKAEEPAVAPVEEVKAEEPVTAPVEEVPSNNKKKEGKKKKKGKGCLIAVIIALIILILLVVVIALVAVAAFFFIKKNQSINTVVNTNDYSYMYEVYGDYHGTSYVASTSGAADLCDFLNDNGASLDENELLTDYSDSEFAISIYDDATEGSWDMLIDLGEYFGYKSISNYDFVTYEDYAAGNYFLGDICPDDYNSFYLVIEDNDINGNNADNILDIGSDNTEGIYRMEIYGTIEDGVISGVYTIYIKYPEMSSTFSESVAFTAEIDD